MASYAFLASSIPSTGISPSSPPHSTCTDALPPETGHQQHARISSDWSDFCRAKSAGQHKKEADRIAHDLSNIAWANRANFTTRPHAAPTLRKWECKREKGQVQAGARLTSRRLDLGGKKAGNKRWSDVQLNRKYSDAQIMERMMRADGRDENFEVRGMILHLIRRRYVFGGALGPFAGLL